MTRTPTATLTSTYTPSATATRTATFSATATFTPAGALTAPMTATISLTPEGAVTSPTPAMTLGTSVTFTPTATARVFVKVNEPLCFAPNPSRPGGRAAFITSFSETSLAPEDWEAVKNGAVMVIDVFNMAGERVAGLQSVAAPGVCDFAWDTAKLPAGIYLYRLNIRGRKIVSGKFALRP